MISFIWAQTKDGTIGDKGTIPWHIKEEFAYFKKVTLNHICVMGRKTWDSLPVKPLPNRENIIITRQNNLKIENVKVLNDVSSLKEKYKNSSEEIFIIGGTEIFKMFLDVVDKLYISIINLNVSGDTKIMNINYDSFKLISEDKHEKFTTKIYKRS